MTRSKEALLRVEQFEVSLPTKRGPLKAVRGVSLHIGRGERVGLVGESGSGKSVLAHSLVRLVPGAQLGGHAWLDGLDLASVDARTLREIRGRRIGVIFQDPSTALDPVRTVGSQVIEAARHRRLSRRAARSEAIGLLTQLGVPHAAERFDDYPHQFSGGMRQRVVIASALMGEPDLLIADEPTTALDVRLQAQLLDLLWTLSEERDLAILLISHDLALVGGFVHRAYVMYAGEIRESAEPDRLFATPAHPYTQGLLQSSPVVGTSRQRHRLIPIKGSPPSPFTHIGGCAFAPRCPHVIERCLVEKPVLVSLDLTNHRSACHRSEEMLTRQPDLPTDADTPRDFHGRSA